ncbi:MAG: hypothetical protein QME66_05475 [Candidatus Eisenbacteria bacterium]|nr:hypothetical protein [Candidatus Eisenbacteria bacterium]
MPQKFTTTMERVASLETDVKNFRGEIGVRFNALDESLCDIKDNHIHALQERMDQHQRLLYGVALTALVNIIVSFIVK